VEGSCRERCSGLTSRQEEKRGGAEPSAGLQKRPRRMWMWCYFFRPVYGDPTHTYTQNIDVFCLLSEGVVNRRNGGVAVRFLSYLIDINPLVLISCLLAAEQTGVPNLCGSISNACQAHRSTSIAVLESERLHYLDWYSKISIKYSLLPPEQICSERGTALCLQSLSCPRTFLRARSKFPFSLSEDYCFFLGKQRFPYSIMKSFASKQVLSGTRNGTFSFQQRGVCHRCA
jgi:hypothetical protein